MIWVHWKKWGNYSGASIAGTGTYLPRDDFQFWEKAVWLTTQVESGGRFGTIINYDGTAMTAGIMQAIAVYPKELEVDDGNPEDDQGPLWKLLSSIKESNPNTTKKLEDALKSKSLILTDKGVLKKIPEMETAPGDYIRNILSPPNGRVPRSGSQWEITKQWALLFHEVFANPDSYEAQVLHGVRHLKDVVERKNKFCNLSTLFEQQKGEILFSSPLQLALCVFLSFSVNAPTMAYRKMKQAVAMEGALFDRDGTVNPLALSKRIIRVFGTADFGRWNMKEPNGRYQRTRKAAMSLWPTEYFEGSNSIMPRIL